MKGLEGSLKQLISSKSEEISHYLISVRRTLHKNPELSFKEAKTSAFIIQELENHGIKIFQRMAGTGLVVLIKGKNPEKQCLLLRGDMDALPIQELNTVEYKSVNPGAMHACGHDVHSTCVLGAAIILNQMRDCFEGTIKIIFQPGEELLPGGASMMIKEGVLEDPGVDKALALHVFPDLESGQAGFRSGKYMASTDEIYLVVRGKGGHAAMKEEYINPLLIASELLLALEKEFTGNIPADDSGDKIPTVLAFGKIEGMGATNIIPENVKIEGTFRTFNEKWRKEAHKKIQLISEEIAARHKGSAEVKILAGYPFLINDTAVTEIAKEVAYGFLGKGNVFDLPLRMTAEDFSFITQKIPSCFFRLGTGNKSLGITHGVHTPYFDIDERAISIGAGLLAAISIALLSDG